MIAQVEASWRRAGVAVSVAAGKGGRITATVAPAEMEPAFTLAVGTLKAAGCRTCWERRRGAWAVFAFSETGSVCIDLSDGTIHRKSPWRRLHGSISPMIALLGPDGVGKSTALRLVRQWFEREAPFVSIAVRQWRPDLLPSLASLAGKPEDPTGNNRPRRKPGKMHWVRLLYYYLDFLVGSWWKDRERTSKNSSRMIVYDRCALDMTVDPYRFALKSRRGTGMLWKLTPRPQTRILLYDSAERIAGRKDDLQEHEVAGQLESWLKLAAADEVHAIIRVNDGPEEIAARLRDLFIDAFVRHYEHDPAPPARLAPGLCDGFEPCASPGDRPASHAVVPSLANPRFLVPLDSRPAAAAALRIYNAQRPIARLARNLLKIGLRVGIAQPFLRHRVRLGNGPLHERLSRSVGNSDILIAVSLGTPGPNQKAALQIMSREGRVLGYAKIGWNERTIASIRNEEAALAMIAGTRFSNAAVPGILDAGWVGDNYVLVQSAVSESATGPVAMDDRHVRFLAELHGLDPAVGPLPCPDKASIARVRRAGFHYYAHLMEFVGNQYSCHRQAPCGPGHGDYTPWNIRSASGKLLVFDWETFEARMPAGWDLFHLLVAGEVEVRSASPGAIYRAITREGPARDWIENYFLAIHAERSLIEPLFVSYAAHALGASVLDVAGNASEKDRALQRTWAALLALSCNPGTADVEHGATVYPEVSEAV